ncbi:hypothetical protein ACEPAG_2280 [Sanghuangporus baumii]
MGHSTNSKRARAMSFPTKPVLNDLFHRKAAVSLDFLIVGGSIGGLACAYNLKQAGHNVRVLERSSGPGNATGGLRVPPNMTKLLLHWGLGDRLVKAGIRCPRIQMLDSENGNFLSELVFHEMVMKELQTENYGVTYTDIYGIIHDITVASGVQIEYNCEVVDVDVEEREVKLASGEILSADLIVGADGATSTVRERMVRRQENHKAGPFTGYTYTIPVSQMKEDTELQVFLQERGVWKVFMGNNTCALTFMAGPDQYAIQLIISEPNASHGWDKLIGLAPIVANFDDYDERVKRLLRLGTQAIETRHVIQEHLEDWFSDDGHVVLLGDAAHNLNPGTSHGSALAMEDAAVLGSLFSRLRTRDTDEILRLLAAYQEIREGRCAEVTRTEYETVAFSVLPKDNPKRAERDAGFAASRQMKVLDWENLDDPFLQHIWEQFKCSFGYEAYDAADDWWVDWGIMRERMKASSMAVSGGSGSSPKDMTFLFSQSLDPTLDSLSTSP